MDHPIRVAILDDHPAVAEGYRTRLSQDGEIIVTDIVLYGEDLLPALAKQRVDVLLLDVEVKTSRDNPSPYNTVHLIPELNSLYPNLNILVISNYDMPALVESVVSAGALGYVFKDDIEAYRDLPVAVHAIARGELYFSQRAAALLIKRGVNRQNNELSDRELEALSLCANYPDERFPRIAERMSIAPSTLRAEMTSVYRKLQVGTREAAVAKARQIGLLPPASSEPRRPAA